MKKLLVALAASSLLTAVGFGTLRHATASYQDRHLREGSIVTKCENPARRSPQRDTESAPR